MDGAESTAASGLETGALAEWVDGVWEDSILPELHDYILIPNKSPLFDPQWREKGHMDRAVRLIEKWCRARDIPGLTVEVVQHGDRTPVILMEVPGDSERTVLLYGHLDKQPEMTGWRAGLDPWRPVREGDKLYGRGGADDGYAAFASLTAIEGLRKHGGRHARCVVLIEACEESGSYDLPHYIDALAERIGSPDLVVCLDSGCGDYERLWSTTSLRGMLVGNLRVDVLEEGVHSGDASGVVPSSFRILRQLIGRLEAAATGAIREDFRVAIPAARAAQAATCAAVLGAVSDKFPFVAGVQPMTADPVEQVLARTWQPALSVTAAAGLPALADGGNVLRPFSAVKLSLRIPPSLDAKAAARRLEELLLSDPPYGAGVSWEPEKAGPGWDAPALASWLGDAVAEASETYFGNAPAYMGEGGSIPFMGMLGEKFPDAQFLITGVLGPHSNAHGPNEFLHVPTGKKLTCCVAEVLQAHLRFVSG
ncbi:MAG TPA: M20/M25/M40 family metallo-hydrolase [Planctomycetota bacterium]